MNINNTCVVWIHLQIIYNVVSSKSLIPPKIIPFPYNDGQCATEKDVGGRE